MLSTYQAKWVNNEIHWIDEPPKTNDELILAITVLPKQETIQTTPKRTPPPELKGMMTFNDDIWDTSEMFAEWEHFK